MKKVKLSIRELNQGYDEKNVLYNINLNIFEGEIVVILGSSGCGKTSLLKSIAGLVPIDSGSILLDNIPIESLPPQERRATMIFQNYALFPHMNVYENLGYGLKIKKLDKKFIRRKIEDVVDLLQLHGLEDRPVANLSGGQQQRVAIGRALIVEPSVLLFDEPLSNLDDNLRKNMRKEIKQILRKAGSTSIYVTHDQNEAISMADRVVVMREGRIEQIDPPEILYNKPSNEYVARFLGFSNIFTADIIDGKISLSGIIIEESPKLTQKKVRVLIRPEEIFICSKDNYQESCKEINVIFYGRIIETELHINIRSYTVSSDLGEVHIVVMNNYENIKHVRGDDVVMVIQPSAFHYLQDQVS